MDAFEELKQRVEENRRCYAAGEIPAPAERRRQLRRMLQWLCREQGSMYALTREGRLPPMVQVRKSIYSLLKPLPKRADAVNILGYLRRCRRSANCMLCSGAPE